MKDFPGSSHGPKKIMPKRIGLIGAGNWGKNYIRTIESIPNVCIPIICTDRGFSISGYKTTTDITDVIDEEVDGVIIATPPENHYEIALKFIENKIPVLLEKPISTELAECQNLLLAAEENDVVFIVNYVHLYSSAFRTLKHEVNSWGQDTIKIISAGGNDGPYRHYDSLYDYGPHDLAMIIKLLGVPYNYEIIEDPKVNGSIYQINMLFNRGTSTSYVGNGFNRKYRNFTVKNMRNGKHIIYNDLTEHKLKINGQKIRIDNSKPLENAVKNFVYELDDRSNWRKELNISKQISLILSSSIS